jgi:Na+/proline symporter
MRAWWRRWRSSRCSSWWSSCWSARGSHLRPVDGPGDLFRQAAAQPDLAALMRFEVVPGGYGGWLSLTFLSMMAFLFLPRQFQVLVVENVNEAHIRKAIWLFPALSVR